jgi:hypothetical protein
LATWEQWELRGWLCWGRIQSWGPPGFLFRGLCLLFRVLIWSKQLGVFHFWSRSCPLTCIPSVSPYIHNIYNQPSPLAYLGHYSYVCQPKHQHHFSRKNKNMENALMSQSP